MRYHNIVVDTVNLAYRTFKTKKELPQRLGQNEVYKESVKEFIRRMEQIEAELEQLEKEKAQLEEALNSGSLPYDELQAKSARIGEIIERNDEITLRWLELSEKV